MPFPHAPTTPRPAARIVIVTVAIVFAGGIYLWRLSELPPAWWSPPPPDDTEVQALAETVEYRLAEETHKVRPADEPWKMRIREEQINAWLSARLPEWLAHTRELDWPEGVGRPQIRFTDDALAVAVDVEIEGRRRWLSATLRPEIVDEQLMLSLDAVALGRLRLPGGSVQTILRELDGVLPTHLIEDPRVRELIESVSNGQHLDPVLDLADGRRLRLRDIVFADGELVVEAETGP